MFAERRKHIRRRVHVAAKWRAGDGAELHDCFVLNVSAGGARLMVDVPEAVPYRIVLLLPSPGLPPQRCYIAWRAGHQVGITFERTLSKAQADALGEAIGSDA